MKIKALAAALAMVPVTALAATAAMDCCKDCCCDDKAKGHKEAPATKG